MDDKALMQSRSWRWLRARVLSLLDRPPAFMSFQINGNPRLVQVPSTRLGYVLNPPDFSVLDDKQQ